MSSVDTDAGVEAGGDGGAKLDGGKEGLQGKQKVSEAVREGEMRKLKDAEAEARSYEITVGQFEGLRSEGGE